MNDEELGKITDMAFGVLRNAVVRTLIPKGQSTVGTHLDRQAELLEPFEAALVSDRRQLHEMLRVAYLAGVQSVHRELHGQPGVDSEMLDEAIEYHSNRIDGHGEPFVS